MTNTMTYRGYVASMTFDAEDKIIVGRVLDADDIITFHGESVSEFDANFHTLVDDYIAACESLGSTPEKLVPNVSRLCGMNLYLLGIGPDGADDHEPPIRTDDALRDEPDTHADVVVTNPPFGKKSSITVVNEEGDTDRQTLTYNRPDFWTTTSNPSIECRSTGCAGRLPVEG